MTAGGVLEEAVTLLAPHVGGRFDPGMRRRLARGLREAASARGLREKQIVAQAAREPDLLRELIDRTVVPETSFFRYAEHFDVLVRHLLPAAGGQVRVWCAACSTGQEPYSVAMALAEVGARDFRIVATDVSAAATERVREASYADRELRGLSPARRDRFMSRVERRWEIVPALRDRVTVARSNVIEDDPPFARGICHVVFCRNVTIYLSPAQVVRAIERIAYWLPPGGHLFLGASESLASVEVPLQLVEIGGTFAYRKLAHPPATGARDGGGRDPSAGEVRASGAPLPATPLAGELLASGDEAARGGDWRAAVRLFRQSAYLAPAEPVPHALLGLALEQVGDARGARRAFSAAQTALERADEVTLGLEGFDLGALRGLLDEKLAKPGS